MNRKLKLWELDRVSPEEFLEQSKQKVIVVLDDIRSFNNVGAFFRTADSFAIEKIYLCGITPIPPHRDIHKTALGATETVKWEFVKDVTLLCKTLQSQGIKIHVLEQAEKTTFLQDVQLELSQTYALIFGNEVNGVAQSVIDIADAIVEIPQFGTKHSLNVSVCGGVVMWEYVKRLSF